MAPSTLSELPKVSYALTEDYDQYNKAAVEKAAEEDPPLSFEDKPALPAPKKAKLIIRVIEHNRNTQTGSIAANIGRVGEFVPVKVHVCEVYKDVLQDSSNYSEQPRDALSRVGHQSVIEIKEHSTASAEALVNLLEILHLSTFQNRYITISDIWEILAAGKKYGLESKSAKPKLWFANWYKANGDDCGFTNSQSLLYPCYSFDHAKGFTAVTKYLVYHGVGHIEEYSPVKKKHPHLHCDQLIIQQLNAARGRLKTILNNMLYDPIYRLIKWEECDCKKEVLYAYQEALTDTEAWPIDMEYSKQSMHGMIGKLGGFSSDFESKTLPHPGCVSKYPPIVEFATSHTSEHFDGLCLDCVTKSKFGNADADYWEPAKYGVKWDHNCRVKHGEPTWYFSFMGRREKMDDRKAKRRERHDFGFNLDFD